METLTEALTLYAAETLIPRFQQETAVQAKASWRKADQLVNKLKALGPEAEQWMDELWEERLAIDFYHEQATLLAGISIGLELGRL